MSPRTSASESDDNPSPEETTDRSAVEQVVELCVFAPIGLALDARTLLPGLVERGRQQVGVARMVGEFAVKWGSTQLEAKVVDAQDQAMAVLRATGLAPVDERNRSGETDPRPAGEDEAPAPGDAGSEAPTTAGEPKAADDHPDDDDRTIDAATLAIPDYDNLSASQVVPRLDGLTDDELDAVGRYEADHRGRNTILNKVAQLQSGE